MHSNIKFQSDFNAIAKHLTAVQQQSGTSIWVNAHCRRRRRNFMI